MRAQRRDQRRCVGCGIHWQIGTERIEGRFADPACEAVAVVARALAVAINAIPQRFGLDLGCQHLRLRRAVSGQRNGRRLHLALGLDEASFGEAQRLLGLPHIQPGQTRLAGNQALCRTALGIESFGLVLGAFTPELTLGGTRECLPHTGHDLGVGLAAQGETVSAFECEIADAEVECGVG